MIDNGNRPAELAPLARRTNGLPPEAPERDRLVLVTGGAGYIGSVLPHPLLDRGYPVRMLDRLYWGRRAIASILHPIELVEAHARDKPPRALRRVGAGVPPAR